MIKTQRLFKRKWLSACSVLLLSFSHPAFAFDSVASAYKSWLDQGNHPVIALGLGGYVTTNIGDSQTFPIHEPQTDSFYIYSANQAMQVVSFGSLFLGDEWAISDRDWLMQAGVEYSESTGLRAKGSLVQGATDASQNHYEYQYNIITRQILIDGKILYTTHLFFHPYVFAGVGMGINMASDYNTTVPPDITFTQEYKSKNTPTFSYAFGFGMDIDIHQNVRLGMGYRFTNLGKVSLGSATIDGISVPGTLSQNTLYTHVLFAQLSLVL